MLAAVAEISPLWILGRQSTELRLAVRLLLPEGEKVGMRGLRRRVLSPARSLLQPLPP